MSQLWAIASNGFREARRNRVTSVVFVFAALMLLSATVALEFTVATFDRVMNDVGLAAMSFISVILSVFLASGLIPKEIERRTVFMVVSKPVSRWVFVVARYLGNVFVVSGALSTMLLIWLLQFQLAGDVHLSPTAYAAFWGIVLEALVLSAVSIFFSVWASQSTTVIASLAVYFVGHMSPELYRMAERSKSIVASALARFSFYLFPNLDRLDMKPQATYGVAISLAELSSMTLYASAYVGVLLAAAVLVFERRDFK